MSSTRYLHPALFLLSALLALSGSATAHAAAAETSAERPTIRIKTGVSTSLKDEAGVVWEADHGFADGDTIERGDITISNTKTPSLYRTERYSMTKFSLPVPNGKYTVKLHFAETFEEINGKGQRVFSFNVEGTEFKDFDVFARAGGASKALVLPVDVEIKDGKLDITFTAKIENPEINALEIIPAK